MLRSRFLFDHSTDALGREFGLSAPRKAFQSQDTTQGTLEAVVSKKSPLIVALATFFAPLEAIEYFFKNMPPRDRLAFALPPSSLLSLDRDRFLRPRQLLASTFENNEHDAVSNEGRDCIARKGSVVMLADDRFVVREMNFDRENGVIDSFVISLVRLTMLLPARAARCRAVPSARIFATDVTGAAQERLKRWFGIRAILL